MKTAMLLLMGLLSTSFAKEFALWNGDMPGKGAEQPETYKPDQGDKTVRLTNVSNPTLMWFPVPDSGHPAPVVIVCPGGGYNILCMDKEGTEVAAWLNSIGVSAAVLKYRVPNNRAGALEDARRAVRMVRDKAAEWKIDPKRVGMLGFSAGGHLTAACSNSPDRPDFSVLIYPAYLFKDGIELSDDIKIDKQTPPAFIAQAQDDKKFHCSSLAYAMALDQQGIPVELHLFTHGGHGFGLRPAKHPASTEWPKLCEQWMRDMGYLAP